MKLTDYLKLNPFVIAPMAGITDHSFRTFIRRLDSSVVVSELISANGLEYHNERTFEMMGFDEEQRPVGLQLFGDDPEILARAAQVVEAKGVDFVDLNFGCPVPKVTKKGAGSAMLKDLVMLQKVLSAVVKAVKIPVTIKVRTGWDHNSLNAHEVGHIAYNEGITWMAIHGRTRSQNYEGKANWDYIGEVKAKVKIPVLGNGDVLTAQEAVEWLKKYNLDGILIGRGALRNPYIFKESLALLQGRTETIQKDFYQLLVLLSELYALRCSDRLREIQLRKFAAWFSTGYPDSAQFRKKLFQSQNCDTILAESKLYFSKLFSTNNPNEESASLKSHEEEHFLMGGHG
jgi:tRNA-dihydrouridine synthase B